MIKICKYLGISKKYLFSQIRGFYAWGSHSKPVKIKNNLEINPLFVEGYALYIAEGNTGFSGQKIPRKLRFTNSEPSVVNFYIKWLKTSFPKIDFYGLEIIPHNKKIKPSNSIKLKLDRREGYYNEKIKYKICMDRSIIIDIILKIRYYIQKIVLKSNRLASSYLKGLMAGEGTVYNNRTKYVRLEMKNNKEINFAKKLLDKLKIKYTAHKRSNRKGMKLIYIGGKVNLMRYYKLVGFGSHQERQRKLEKLIKSYNSDKVEDCRDREGIELEINCLSSINYFINIAI